MLNRSVKRADIPHVDVSYKGESDNVMQWAGDKEAGFSLVELMVAVMIIGILVAVAAPVFRSAQINATKRTCLSNQRQLEGACMVWVAEQAPRGVGNLQGLVDASHPLITDGAMRRPPSCPAAPIPADRNNPGAGEGAYTINNIGEVVDCTYGEPVAHGHY